MTVLETLIADLRKLQPDERVFLWAGWDRDYPRKDTDFRQYLVRSADMLEALTGDPAPPPAVTRVKVTTPVLNVREQPMASGKKVGSLPQDAIVSVRVQVNEGWWQIDSGDYKDGYISAQYTEVVT